MPLNEQKVSEANTCTTSCISTFTFFLVTILVSLKIKINQFITGYLSYSQKKIIIPHVLYC